MYSSALRFGLVASLASVLAACGGGGGSSGGGTPNPPVANASPGGLWQGIDPISRLPVYALAAEDGRFQLIVDDGAPLTQYWGTLATSGNSLSSSNVQVATGTSYLGTANITGGSITARQSMTATVSYTPAPGCAPTVCGNAQSGSPSLTFNPVYNQGGALSRIAGNWLCHQRPSVDHQHRVQCVLGELFVLELPLPVQPAERHDGHRVGFRR